MGPKIQAAKIGFFFIFLYAHCDYITKVNMIVKILVAPPGLLTPARLFCLSGKSESRV